MLNKVLIVPARCSPVCPQEALDNLMLEGDNIVSAARRAIMRHDYSAVLTIFPILRHLKMNKSEFDSTLQVPQLKGWLG